MDKYLPFALPDIGQEEIDEVTACLKSGWITTGPRVAKFEDRFAKYIECSNAMAVNSATSGLHLALEAIGIKKDDIVITSPYTFTATAEVIRYFDAHPLFCDINPKTFNLDPEQLEVLLEKNWNHRIKAIMPVHIAGQSCDLDPILKIAKKYGLKVVTDSAHAIPTTYEGKNIAQYGDLNVFSFYATKTLACGEGGMVTSQNEKYIERMKVMRLHGFSRDAWDRYHTKTASWYYEVIEPGFKYNMTDIMASLGLQQLRKVERFYDRRLAIAIKYNEAFKDLKNFKIPFVERPKDRHAYHLYIIKVNSKKRNEFIEMLNEKGIGCSVHFIPLHLQPYWRKKYSLNDNDYPLALEAYKGAISLPIYTKMLDSDVDRVIQAVIEANGKLK